MIANLPDQDTLLQNFSRCYNWEDKYLYMIELGSSLPPLPLYMRTTNNLIVGCQSQVWLFMVMDVHGYVQLYGDSDAAIVKGLMAIVFIFYQGLTPAEIITKEVQPFFKSLALVKHITPSRSQGLEAIVNAIRTQANCL